jgi:hypothetical protein
VSYLEKEVEFQTQEWPAACARLVSLLVFYLQNSRTKNGYKYWMCVLAVESSNSGGVVDSIGYHSHLIEKIERVVSSLSFLVTTTIRKRYFPFFRTRFYIIIQLE